MDPMDYVLITAYLLITIIMSLAGRWEAAIPALLIGHVVYAP